MASNIPSFYWFVICRFSISSGILSSEEPVCGRNESAENIFFFRLLNFVREALNHDSSSILFSASLTSYFGFS